MKKLWLAQFIVYTTPYMGSEFERVEYTRIVFADTEKEVEEKVEAAFPSEDYSYSKRVSFIDISAAIE